MSATNQDITFTILGCGNSTGVPAAGNYWGQCDPNEPKNRRTRPSLLIQSKTTTIIIDSGADFRQQTTHENVDDIDAILYTHAHGDHVNGIDDLRIYAHLHKKQIPLYANQETLDDLTHRFHYLFEDSQNGLYKSLFIPAKLDNQYGKAIKVGDIEVIPFEQDHGSVKSVGYRINDLGYSVDMKRLDPNAIQTLQGINTWIVDAAGYHQENNPVHANLNEIYAFNEQIGAKTTYLSSLSLTMDYKTMINELPNGYKPAYDGLKL